LNKNTHGKAKNKDKNTWGLVQNENSHRTYDTKRKEKLTYQEKEALHTGVTGFRTSTKKFVTKGGRGNIRSIIIVSGKLLGGKKEKKV